MPAPTQFKISAQLIPPQGGCYLFLDGPSSPNIGCTAYTTHLGITAVLGVLAWIRHKQQQALDKLITMKKPGQADKCQNAVYDTLGDNGEDAGHKKGGSTNGVQYNYRVGERGEGGRGGIRME